METDIVQGIDNRRNRIFHGIGNAGVLQVQHADAQYINVRRDYLVQSLRLRLFSRFHLRPRRIVRVKHLYLRIPDFKRIEMQLLVTPSPGKVQSFKVDHTDLGRHIGRRQAVFSFPIPENRRVGI